MREKHGQQSEWFSLACVLLTVAPFFFAFTVEAGEFKFVVWGDSQFQNPEVFERIVKETELLKPALVVQVGDLIHGYTYDPEIARRHWQRFKKQIAPLTVPYYPVPGNHDVTTAEIEPVYGEVWGEDKYYYSFDHEGSHFIVLDTDLKQQMDTIPEEEMEWFKQDLEKHKDADNIFIFFHSPLYRSSEYDWDSVHELLTNYPIRAVFTGHSHVYDYQVRDGIDYFIVNTSGEINFSSHLVGRSHHFLVVSVDGTAVDYAVLTEGRIYPVDAVTAADRAKGSRYLQADQTILIPDPSKRKVKARAEITIRNRAEETREYVLSWETDDYGWEFKPWGADFTLEPGEEKKLKFKIKGPKGEFTRDELPKLRVDSPFTSEKGWETTLSYYYGLFYPPETVAKRLKKKMEIELDGRMDEVAWEKVPAIEELFVDKQGTPAPERNMVKVAYDEEYLYVGVWGEEPNPEGLAAFAHGELPLVFGDDDFELFFDTNRDLSSFYRLMVNPKGTVLCSGPEGLFSFEFEVETAVGDEYWGAEFRIPFAELKTKRPKKGKVWGFNVRRHRQQAELAQRDWSKMRNFPYEPPYFGLLEFN